MKTEVLTKHHVADGVGHIGGLYHGLDNSVASLNIATSSNSQQNLKPVNVGGRSLGSDFGHKNTTDQCKNTAEDIPRLEVAQLSHEMTVGQNSCTEHDDERQQPNSGLNSTVTPSELEVERSVVNGDEAGRVYCRCASEQHNSVVVAEEVAREETVGQSGKHGEALLQTKDDEEHA